MISYVLILLAMSFVDSMLAALFPFDTSYVIMSFVPSLAFLTLALLSRRVTLRQSLFLALLLGMYQDFMVNHTVFLYSALYAVVIAISSFWSKSIDTSPLVDLIFVITTLFAKELILYFVMTISSITALTLLQWFWKRELLTIIIHFVLSLFVLKVVDQADQFLKAQDINRRKGEKVKWLQLRLKEEKKR